MRQRSFRRVLVLVLCLMSWARCSAVGPVVEVLVRLSEPGLVAKVQSLDVSAQLDKVSADPGHTVGPDSLSRFLINLPSGASGTLALQIDGLGAHGCVVAHGGGSLVIGAEASYTLPILLEAQDGCLLRLVGLPSEGPPQVESDPPGILCPGQCEKSYAVGTKVKLIPHTYLDWSEAGCQSCGPCQVTVQRGISLVSATGIQSSNDPSNCGGCGITCSSDHVTPACSAGSCQAGTCASGFSDCNNDKQRDGCEVSLLTDAGNCGGCGAACSGNHVTPACSAGSCQAGTCASGFSDCNNDKLTDGCEVSLLMDVGNCGGCGAACSGNHVKSACSAGSCQAGTCASGFSDCNNDKLTDGCETSIQLDPRNCSDCGVICSSNHVTAACTAGSCQGGTCALGYRDCNNNKQTDGCETLTMGSDMSNCGGCGVTCSSNHVTPTCNAGSCQAGTCASGYSDCNNDKQRDGCEARVCRINFQPAPGIAVGSSPRSVQVGDFNGDSKPDLAVANSGSDNVSVLLGNGDGTFQAARNFAVGMGPSWVAVGDFNGDSKPDLAVDNASANVSVSVLLGNGDGTFQGARSFAAGGDSSAVVVGDFNGDSKPDLAVTHFGSDNVGVLLGNGDGTFQAAQNFAVGMGPSSVAVGDFNGDSKPDLAVTNLGTDNVSVLLGRGDGTFQGALSFAVGAFPLAVAVGEFNGDSKPDLAIASLSGGSVSVLLGNGNGTFQAAKNFIVGMGPLAVAVGDFNGDSKPDLAVANNASPDVSVLLGNGNGTFQGALSFAVGTFPLAVVVGDFSGDSKPDLVTVDGSKLLLLLNTSQ